MNDDYLTKIQQLVELQKIDDQIFKVREIQIRTPQELKEIEEEFQQLEERKEQALDKQHHLQEQEKRILNEIEEESNRIKKSRNKLMQVGNNREFQAMMREMDSMEKINRDKEAEKVAILEALAQVNNELEEIESKYEALKKMVEEKRASIDDTLKAAAEELAQLQKSREHASSFIPEKVFQRYEFIRSRLEHPVIVDVQESVCSGCNIAIPPQTFIDLQSSEQILNCPNCQRIIFWSEHYQMPDRPVRPRRKSAQRLEQEESEEALDQEE